MKKNIRTFFSKRVSGGMIYVGSSAGAVIASPNISLETHFEDRKNPPEIVSYEALNLCNFHCLPHWGSEDFNKAYMHMLSSGYEQNVPLITLTDKQAVEIIDGKMKIIAC